MKIWQGIKSGLRILKNLFLACGKFLQGVTGKKAADNSPVVSSSEKIASSDFNAENLNSGSGSGFGFCFASGSGCSLNSGSRSGSGSLVSKSAPAKVSALAKGKIENENSGKTTNEKGKTEKAENKNFPETDKGENSPKTDKGEIATEGAEKTGTIRLIENRVAELKRNAKKIADISTKEEKLEKEIKAIYDPEIIQGRVLHGATLKRWPTKEVEKFFTPETDKQGLYAEKQLLHDKAGWAPHAYEREGFGTIALIWGNGRGVGLNHIMGERIKTGIAYGLLLHRLYGILIFGEYEQINPDRFLFAKADFYAVVERHPTTPGVFILVDFFEYGPHLIRKSRGRKNRKKKIIVTFPGSDEGLPTNYTPTHRTPPPQILKQ